MVGMFLKGVTRLVTLTLTVALSGVAHIDTLPGLQPEQLFKIIWAGLQGVQSPEALHWHALDEVECDASHELSDIVLVVRLLRALVQRLTGSDAYSVQSY